MTIEQLFISLRTKLIEARQTRDERLLSELSTVFTILEEIAVEKQSSRDLIVALSDLGWAARNTSGKADWFGQIPTEGNLKSVAKQ